MSTDLEDDAPNTLRLSVRYPGEQQWVSIQIDFLELVMRNRMDQLRSRDWIGPLSLFVSLMLTCATTNTRDYFLSAAEWKAIFTLGILISFIWTLVALIQFFRSKSIVRVQRDIIEDLLRKARATQIVLPRVPEWVPMSDENDT